MATNDPKPTPAELDERAQRRLHDRLKGGQEPLEDLPEEWDAEDRALGNRKPDLAEVEDDISRL